MIEETELIEKFRDMNLIMETLPQGTRLGTLTLTNEFIEEVKKEQARDENLQKEAHGRDNMSKPDFLKGSDGLWRYQGRLCVPEGGELRQQILEEGHKSDFSIHPGTTKMYQDLKKMFWWPGMKKDIMKKVTSCLTCQKVKAEHQKPSGSLQPLSIPEWKWEGISMDFVSGLPRTITGHDAIWVIVDRLTKSAHFIAVNMTFPLEKLARIYVKEIVRLHGVPANIVSDRDPRFVSKFWGSLHEALGTRLSLSSAYHPQSDGQSERTIQTLEDMLRACVLDYKGSWEDFLPLAEFSYNNSYHSSLGMAPFEALYGRRCKTPLCWLSGEDKITLGPELLQEMTEKVRSIREKLRIAQDRQKAYYDKRRKPLEFQEGDHVFLRVTPITGVGRSIHSKKLTPKYLGPYQILDRIGAVAYRIALPPSLSNLHDVFHISQLRKYLPDSSHVIEPDNIELEENLTYPTQPVKILERREKQLRKRTVPLVKLAWSDDNQDATWELEESARKRYPSLFGNLLMENFGDEILKRRGECNIPL